MPFKVEPPLYATWQGMKRRCLNPNFKQWADYGGRGITVCDRWMHDYAAFAADMGPKPSPNHSIDRKDNDAGYSPENCIWSTKKHQQRNRRVKPIMVTIEGREYMLAELCEISGQTHVTVKVRALRGDTYKQVIDPTKRTLAEWSKIGRKKWSEDAKIKTHAKCGHELTPENTSITRQGWRLCRTCHNARKRSAGGTVRKVFLTDSGHNKSRQENP